VEKTKRLKSLGKKKGEGKKERLVEDRNRSSGDELKLQPLVQPSTSSARGGGEVFQTGGYPRVGVKSNQWGVGMSQVSVSTDTEKSRSAQCNKVKCSRRNDANDQRNRRRITAKKERGKGGGPRETKRGVGKKNCINKTRNKRSTNKGQEDPSKLVKDCKPLRSQKKERWGLRTRKGESLEL